MRPEEELKLEIDPSNVKSLSAGVQKFYNGPCAAIDITSLVELEPLRRALEPLLPERADASQSEGQ